MKRFCFVIISLLLLHNWSLGTNNEGCDSPQYLRYREPGVISCSFHDNFAGIFWYDSTNTIFDEPIVTFSNSVKGGGGFDSGEFDIDSNGSLVITYVNEVHEKNFTVAKFTSLDEDPITFVIFVNVTEVTMLEECDSPQYLEFGTTATVRCHFKSDFDSVFWYNSTETVLESPLLTYSQSVKSGRGYESGEFDVDLDGSLVIKNVGLVHEHYFTVAKFTSLNEDPTKLLVSVIVIVKPLLRRPVIETCGTANTICYLQLDSFSTVNCVVHRARPVVYLKWFVRTSSGDRNITSKMTLISNNLTYTSQVATSHAFAYSPLLSLLVCRANFVPGTLQTDESLVLLQNRERNFSSVQPVMKYALRGSTLELKCTDIEISLLVWRKSFPHDNQYENVLFATFDGKQMVTEKQDHFMLGKNGSLIITHIDIQHDGFYGCIYGGSITDGMKKYKVITYVNPVPEYPLVHGCKFKQCCILEVHRKGNLTCSMTGVRPEVELEWKASSEISSERISFFDQISTVTETGETFNITLTSSYSVTSVTREKIECRISGPNSDIFPVKSEIYLLFPSADQIDSSAPARIPYGWILFLCSMIVWICFATYHLRNKLKRGLLRRFIQQGNENC